MSGHVAGSSVAAYLATWRMSGLQLSERRNSAPSHLAPLDHTLARVIPPAEHAGLA